MWLNTVLLIFFLVVLFYNFFTKKIKENFSSIQSNENIKRRNKMTIQERFDEIENTINERYNKLSIIKPNIKETKKDIKKVGSFFYDRAKKVTGMDENSTVPKATGIE
jgi:hypothetical protein